MNLAQHTVLHCASNLDLRLDSSNQVQIILGDNSVTCGPHGLLVLNTFATPRPLGDGLAELRGSVVGMQDWIDLTTVVGQLYEAGVLRAAGQTADRWPDISMYTSIEETVADHDNVERVTSMLEAIRRTVRPGDVVIDLNGGPGIFAIASALAGASAVYSVESESYASLAQAAFEANGIADHITLLSALPAPEDVPTLADLLIADVTCSDLLFGDTLRSLRSCRRLLKPGARTLPSQIWFWALPVTIPHAELQRHTFTADVVAHWQSWYGIDFTPLVQIAANSALLYPLRLQAARDWPAVAGPVALVETSLLAIDALPPTVSVPFNATAAGLLNGVVLYLDIQYCPSVNMSTHPANLAPNSFSSGFYWVFDRPIEVQAGDQLSLLYGREPLSKDVRISVTRV